jgi:hypothetical protein
MNQEPVSTTLDLRPIPPPEPVPLPNGQWWLWLVPAVLIAFLWYWWTRRPVARPFTPREMLLEAIDEAREGNDPEATFTIDRRFREFLAERQGVLWLSTPYAEAKSLWEELLPQGQSDAWYERFSMLEQAKFSQISTSSEGMEVQTRVILELLAHLDENDKLMKLTNIPAHETNRR